MRMYVLCVLVGEIPEPDSTHAGGRHTQDDDDVYPSPAEGQADASTDEGGIPKSEAGQTAGNNVPLGVQGVAPDQARMQGTDQGTQGWAAEGAHMWVLHQQPHACLECCFQGLHERVNVSSCACMTLAC